MQLEEYTQSRANKLSKLAFPETDSDSGIKVHWIRWIAFENSSNVSRQKHKHSFYEAHFVLTGTNGYTVSGGENIALCEGEGLIIPPETAHKVNALNEDLKKISITFTVSEDKNIFSKSTLRAPLYFKLNSEIIADLNGILREADRLDGFSPTIIRNRIFGILCAVIRMEHRSESSDSPLELPNSDIRIDSAKQYIEDNKNLFLTCDDVAHYCHFNTKYLNRIFKAQTGQTLLEYIHGVKQKEAERLLSETELSLPEIAQALGFSNEYYFNSFFKRASTVSPGAYRKMIRS